MFRAVYQQFCQLFFVWKMTLVVGLWDCSFHRSTLFLTDLTPVCAYFNLQILYFLAGHFFCIILVTLCFIAVLC